MRAALLLLLFALPAHAATFTCNFETIAPGSPVPPFTSGGITATFECGYAVGVDQDWPLDYTCHLPSGTHYLAYDWQGEACGNVMIHFSTALYKGSLRYTGSRLLYVPGFEMEGSIPIHVVATDNYYHTIGEWYFNETGNCYEGACPFPTCYNSTTDLGHWSLAEWQTDAPFNNIYIFPANGLAQSYYDDLKAYSWPPPCPDPPCEWERATRAPGETPTPHSTWGAVKVIWR